MMSLNFNHLLKGPSSNTVTSGAELQPKDVRGTLPSMQGASGEPGPGSGLSCLARALHLPPKAGTEQT